MVIRTALALNCTIAMDSIFHRKNYFYPDLPKGYQVSQYGDTNPIGYNGYLEIPTQEGGTKKIRIRRVHLEEDTGKLMHLPNGGSGVDYNRAGTPLMEIVTEFPPDIQNDYEAKEYLVQLRQILLYLGVCDGKMEEGSLRCEPNISVRPEGAQKFGTKTELKNLNSFRSVQLGSGYEIRRQIAVYESGGTVLQETRGWNEVKEQSYVMRLKESENDYRYFPDPDLIPMAFDQETIDRLRAELPKLPLAKKNRYMSELGLGEYDAGVLTSDLELTRYFEATVAEGGDPKASCNWITQEFAKLLNESGQTLATSKVTPAYVVELTQMIANGDISGKIGKEVFEEVFATGKSPRQIVEEKGVTQVSDESFIRDIVQKVINENGAVVEKFKSGQVGVKGFFVGQVMKQSQGRANPQIAQKLVDELLGTL
jgi:aspartyl-tRNA(Asn)/glutamyl-tRNA(Gln) amidotransferase subunit B